LAVLTGIAGFLNRDELLATLGEIHLLWLALGLLLHLANYYFRALRLRILAGRKFQVWPDACRMIGTHGVTTYLLPFRTGELALPTLLRSGYGIGWGEGLGLLIWVRVMDLCALGIWILVAAALLDVNVSGGFMASWVFVGVILTASPAIIRAMARIVYALPNSWQNHLKQLEGRGHISLDVILVSLGVWTMSGISLYCVARSVGMPLGIGDIWFLVTVQLPLQLSPVQGLANAGNHELGWVAALAMLGMGSGEALTFALATHTVHIIYISVIALLVALMALTASDRSRA
jgi:hypothetical protein